jgi:hypothetical protein
MYPILVRYSMFLHEGSGEEAGKHVSYSCQPPIQSAAYGSCKCSAGHFLVYVSLPQRMVLGWQRWSSSCVSSSKRSNTQPCVRAHGAGCVVFSFGVYEKEILLMQE